MIAYERSYATARSLFGLLEFAGWAVVVLGGLSALAGFSTGGVFGAFSSHPPLAARLVSIIPGLGFALMGIFAVCWVQVGRANVDTAEMTRDMLLLARADGGGTRPMKQVGVNPLASGQPTIPHLSHDIKGTDGNVKRKIANFQISKETIMQYEGKYRIAGHEFNTLDEVKDFILFNTGSILDFMDIVKRSQLRWR